MEYTIPENIGLIPTEAQSEYPETDTERRLAIDIIDWWDVHVQAQTTVATTTEELKVIRQNLGERLHEMKQLLARPGRNGEWSPFLKEHKIPRTTADRLVAAHERLLAPETNCTTGAIHKPTAFILCLISRASLAYERRDEGILLFHPRVSAPGEPKSIAQEGVPPAEPANGNYGDVV